MTFKDPMHIVRDYLLGSGDLTGVVGQRVFAGKMEGGVDQVPCIWFAPEPGPMEEQAPMHWMRIGFRCLGGTLLVAQELVEILRLELQVNGAYAERAPGFLGAIHDSGPFVIPDYADDPVWRAVEGQLVYYRCLLKLGVVA
jgi:hypothetical protein